MGGMGNIISYESNYIVTWGTALAAMKYVTTPTKDYGYAECEC
jgi:hypothetical protein